MSDGNNLTLNPTQSSYYTPPAPNTSAPILTLNPTQSSYYVPPAQQTYVQANPPIQQTYVPPAQQNYFYQPPAQVQDPFYRQPSVIPAGTFPGHNLPTGSFLPNWLPQDMQFMPGGVTRQEAVFETKAQAAPTALENAVGSPADMSAPIAALVEQVPGASSKPTPLPADWKHRMAAAPDANAFAGADSSSWRDTILAGSDSESTPGSGGGGRKAGPVGLAATRTPAEKEAKPFTASDLESDTGLTAALKAKALSMDNNLAMLKVSADLAGKDGAAADAARAAVTDAKRQAEQAVPKLRESMAGALNSFALVTGSALSADGASVGEQLSAAYDGELNGTNFHANGDYSDYRRLLLTSKQEALNGLANGDPAQINAAAHTFLQATKARNEVTVNAVLDDRLRSGEISTSSPLAQDTSTRALLSQDKQLAAADKYAAALAELSGMGVPDSNPTYRALMANEKYHRAAASAAESNKTAVLNQNTIYDSISGIPKGADAARIQKLVLEDPTISGMIDSFNAKLADRSYSSAELEAERKSTMASIGRQAETLAKNDRSQSFFGWKNAWGDSGYDWGNIMAVGGLALALYGPIERRQSERRAERRADKQWEKEKDWWKERAEIEQGYRLEQIGAMAAAEEASSGGSVAAVRPANF